MSALLDRRATKNARPSRRRRHIACLSVSIAILAVSAVGVAEANWAARAALEGKAAMLQAESHLAAGNIAMARKNLDDARLAFTRMRGHWQSLEPILKPARRIPLLRVQLRGIAAFAETGLALALAGTELTDSLSLIVDPSNPDVRVAEGVELLRTSHESVRRATGTLESAISRIAALDGYRLIGPLEEARVSLSLEMARLHARALTTERDLGSLVAFFGGQNARRYLLLSQNPEEVRPTGGFIGTYGILAAQSGQLRLDRYGSIESWYMPRPEAVVSPKNAPFILRLTNSAQTLANVNAVADWPQVAQLASELWRRGGEEPVDGVISYTPALLVRILSVVGAVTVSDYDETVTANNLVQRLEQHTHEQKGATKDYVSAVAEAVLQRLLDAPADRWEALGRAIGQSFDARETMAWSSDPDISETLARRQWDGALAPSDGDFFYGAEFEAAAKNGRALRRIYNHNVVLREDGTARVNTKIFLSNPAPIGESNPDSLCYIVLYGPSAAVLDSASDVPVSTEAALGGHSAAGWLRTAVPGARTSLNVVWEAPKLALQQEDGRLEYRLKWWRVPDHSGDVLTLNVVPPEGWRWDKEPPPTRVELSRDFTGSWFMART